MLCQQEVAGGDPGRRHLLGRRAVEPGLLKPPGRCLPGPLGVGVEQVEGPDRSPDRAQVAAVPATGPDQPVDDRDQEGARPARRLYQSSSAEVLILRVPHQIEDQLDDPTTGEHLAVVSARISGEFSQRHRDLDQGQLTCSSHDDHLPNTSSIIGRSPTTQVDRSAPWAP